MCGDAPGDDKAAEKNGVLYFPILVNHEGESWARFRREGFEKFMNGSFAGSYQEALDIINEEITLIDTAN